MDNQTKSNIQDLEPADSLLAWSLLAGETAADLVKLSKAELLLSVRRIPSLFTLCIVLVQFVLLLWLGIAALLSWGLTTLTGGGLGAALVFFTILQALACFLVWRGIAIVAQSMSFPHTRANISILASALAGFAARDKQP